MEYVQLPYVSPRVAEEFQRGRNVLLSGPINKDVALRFMLVLKDLESSDPDSPIWVIMDSKGGEVQAGWSIIDAMALCKAPVHAVCYGEACSIAAVIFASAPKGNRHMMRHAKLMIHQPWTDIGAWPMNQTSLSDASEDLARTRSEIESALSAASGLPLDRVHGMCERDFVIDAQEAIRMGFADSVL